MALPFYSSLGRPLAAIPALLRSIAVFWRSLSDLDCVWLLGPHPLGIAFAFLALLRGRRVVLGVRQDLPEYVRNRHPRRPFFWLAGWLMESVWRALGMLVPVVAVGPELADHYRRSREVLEITVSLIRASELIEPANALTRSYDGELRVLSVGRLDEEKNPLLLAEALARLNKGSRDWRLVVCGEGQLREALEERLAELGQSGRADVLGYVAFGEDLTARYRESHVLLHTSWTEGLPGVLPEAFAAGLPAVAADVGGIRAAIGDAALLVPPGDAPAAAAAVRSIAEDEQVRGRLVEAGHRYAVAHTMEAETRRVAELLRGA